MFTVWSGWWWLMADHAAGSSWGTARWPVLVPVRGAQQRTHLDAATSCRGQQLGDGRAVPDTRRRTSRPGWAPPRRQRAHPSVVHSRWSGRRPVRARPGAASTAEGAGHAVGRRGRPRARCSLPDFAKFATLNRRGIVTTDQTTTTSTAMPSNVSMTVRPPCVLAARRRYPARRLDAEDCRDWRPPATRSCLLRRNTAPPV